MGGLRKRTALHGVEVHDALRALRVIARQHARVRHEDEAPVQVVVVRDEQPVLGEDVHALHARPRAVIVRVSQTTTEISFCGL